MKLLFPVLLSLALAAPILALAAAPVHVALKASAAVSPNADGFFTLGAVADLSGGDLNSRARLAAVPIGRAPLAGAVRLVTRGDLALKLRQAGCHPDKEAVLEGASQSSVSVTEQVAAAPKETPRPPVLGEKEGTEKNSSSSPLVHRGQTVTIVVQDGDLAITARGVARDEGAAGQTIRVHREGVMTDLNASVLDAQTVQLEM